jgi:hypothetical protein
LGEKALRTESAFALFCIGGAFLINVSTCTNLVAVSVCEKQEKDTLISNRKNMVCRLRLVNRYIHLIE